MKKSYKITLTVFAVAVLLLTIMFSFSTAAEEAPQYELSNIVFLSADGNEIIDINGNGDGGADELLGGYTYTLREAVELAPDGCVIAILKSVTFDGRVDSGLIEINKSVLIGFANEDQTESLGLPASPELTVIQNGEGTAGFDITSSDATLSFLYGKVNVIDVSGEPGSYPLITSSNGSDINLVIDSTSTYMGSLVYSDVGNASVLLNSGEHHILYSPKGTKTDSAWIECGGAADIEVNYSTVVSLCSASAFSFVDGDDDGAYSDVSVEITASSFGAADSSVNVISNLHRATDVHIGEDSLIAASLAPNVVGELPDGVYPISISKSVSLGNVFDFSGIDIESGIGEEAMVILLNQLFAHLSIDPSIVEDVLNLGNVGIGNIPGISLPTVPCVTTDYRIAMRIADTPTNHLQGLNYMVSSDPLTEGFITQYVDIGCEVYISFAPLSVVDIYNNDGELVESITGVVGTTVYPARDWLVTEFSEPNGWYMWKNSGRWISEKGWAYDYPVISEGTVAYYPEKTVKPHMTSLTWNMTLGTHFTVNIGIPTVIPEGITVNGVSGKGTSPEAGYAAMKARWDGASSTEYPGPGPYQEYTMCAISDFVYSVYACSQSLAAYRFNEMVPEPGN